MCELCIRHIVKYWAGPGMVVLACNPIYPEAPGRRMTVQGQPRQKQETLSEKWTKKQRSWCVAKVVECLPSKHKAVSLIPSTPK
jgi:hypothetical protein